MLTSCRAVIRAEPASCALTASGEYMNWMSSQACWGNLVLGLRNVPPPPDIDTRSWPLTPAPLALAGISAKPTSASRVAIGAEPLSGLMTERQK